MQVGLRNSLLQREIARRRGKLPPSFRERLVAETCRYRVKQCATLLAQWRHEAPVSPERDRMLAKIESDPKRQIRMPLRMVEPLSQLFGDGKLIAERELSPAACQRATGYFSR